ncbi:MAG: FadR family transcriptional regulator [Rhodospirillales bacterium]|nr:FadR family transcriptional regulator [Rhodospirillales bacterium]
MRVIPSTSPAESKDWKLSDQVYERILSKIVDGEFPENSKLPTEIELSKQLQVSRPVLRQALARLRQDEVISSRQGSGSYVMRRPAPQMLDFAPVGSIADIQRCFEFRAAVEGAAAALAAERRTEADLVNIENALKAMAVAIESGELGVEADEQFHAAIAEATANQFFVSTRASMLTQIQFGMSLTRNLSRIQTMERMIRVQKEHDQIFVAIRDRKPEQAQHQMRTHINNARLRVFEG